MPRVDAVVSCDIVRGFRTAQIAGLFDLKLEDKSTSEFHAEVPDTSETWDIGMIVGPSGSGKSTIARKAFGGIYASEGWPDSESVVDAFGDMPVKDITGLLTAVGFSSPPSWVKPYRVLSNGEKFRCDLARSVAKSGVVVFDEFTSVVDRNVAKVCSAALAKAIRGNAVRRCRFVAVSCHYDIIEWLEPDWVVDMATGETARGRLWRRPNIQLDIFSCKGEAWKLFAQHHYLNTSRLSFARTYIAAIGGEPVGFAAVLSSPRRGAPKTEKRFRVSRIVVLPDYQGIGIGSQLLNAIGEIHSEKGHLLAISTSHPAMISYLKRSHRWKVKHVYKTGGSAHKKWEQRYETKGVPRPGVGSSSGRAMVSAEYITRQLDVKEAEPSEDSEVLDASAVVQHPREICVGAGKARGIAIGAIE